MSVLDPCLIRSRGSSGEPVVRLGVPLADDYLEFLAGRCRPNTVLAAAEEPGGVATSTVACRVSMISGFFGYLQARGDIDANPVPRGLPTRRAIVKTCGSACHATC